MHSIKMLLIQVFNNRDRHVQIYPDDVEVGVTMATLPYMAWSYEDCLGSTL